jgi:hypothetical protein
VLSGVNPHQPLPYQCGIRVDSVEHDGLGMKKRVLAAVLWFYAAWYCWAIVANALGVTDLFGPVLGAALAAFFAGDPLHRIWPPQVRDARRIEPEVGIAKA